MADADEHKLSDAIPHKHPEAGGDRGGRPVSTRKAAAEQIREAEESKDACRAKASNRDRMVDIGRGNQQTGRQGR